MVVRRSNFVFDRLVDFAVNCAQYNTIVLDSNPVLSSCFMISTGICEMGIGINLNCRYR